VFGGKHPAASPCATRCTPVSYRSVFFREIGATQVQVACIQLLTGSPRQHGCADTL
jgi:hypothetical protein